MRSTLDLFSIEMFKRQAFVVDGLRHMCCCALMVSENLRYFAVCNNTAQVQRHMVLALYKFVFACFLAGRFLGDNFRKGQTSFVFAYRHIIW